jgi:two-component system, NtrC family, response regulator HydG
MSAPLGPGDDLAARFDMAPVLVADRFCVTRAGHAIDLATGEPVWIRTRAFASADERERWLRFAATLCNASHPHLIGLADFGPVGPSADFEAWQCPPPPHQRWRRFDAAALATIEAVTGLLRAHGLEPCRPRTSVLDVGGRLAVWAGDDEGTLAVTTAGQPLDSPPAVREVRRVIDRVADVLDGGVSGRPRSVRLLVPALAEPAPVIAAVARCARLRGYVPVASRLVAREEAATGTWRAAIEGRHVLLLSDGDAPAGAEAVLFFLSQCLASNRPHVWLHLKTEREIRRASIEAPAFARVAEESAPYSADAVIAAWTPALAAGRPYHDPAPSAVVQAAAVGRHAQVERWLREAEGRCSRRRDWAGAGEAELALGRLCLWRGRVPEATRAFESAHRLFGAADLAPRAVTAAAFAGLALTDAGRFCDAESALRAASVAAGAMDDPVSRTFALQGLARCLLWQDRFDEALDCLRTSPIAVARAERTIDPGAGAAQGERPARPRALGQLTVCERPGVFAAGWPIGVIDPGVAHACLEARAAIGARDLVAAGRATSAARDRAIRSGTAADVAAACRVRAMLFGALGDLRTMREQIDEGLDAARRAHHPLRAIRLRMVLAEALLRERNLAEARPLLARLARLDPQRLPRVISQPLERLIRGETSERRRGAPSATRSPDRVSRGTVATRISLGDLLAEVLGVCESIDDEREALRKIAVILRGRLRAVAVACVASDGGSPWVVAHEGVGRSPDEVAARALDLGLPVPPSSTRSGLEGAVPIRSAGTAIGAWVCRWAADEPPDWERSVEVLSAAAVAVAAFVRALADRRAVSPLEAKPGGILGVSDAVRALRAEIVRAASAPFNVVVEGESGSGKELVARAIHHLGPRANRPLCALNCAALTDELLEAELFGHARGAFTGAVSERKGLFEEAHQGTLVLDEAGELTPRAQAKLLRAIQEGEVRRVGENLPRAVDVRIIAASNRPLRSAVESGAFRADLLYRLEVIRITVPPLRARIEDIPILAAHFWQESAARVGSRCTLSPAALAALARYHWPGNVRELQNVMAALAVGAGRRGSVTPDRLPLAIGTQAASQHAARRLDEARQLFEAGFVRAALARAGGKRAQAATDLGLTRQGLSKLLIRLGIE